MKKGTLRLHMPRWQGGNLHDYRIGSELLAWLAPAADGLVETVPVPQPAGRLLPAAYLREPTL
jgi:arginase